MQPEPELQLNRNQERIEKFVLAQYAALRQEIKWIILQVDALETAALVFSGAI